MTRTVSHRAPAGGVNDARPVPSKAGAAAATGPASPAQLPQHRLALQRANRTRLERAALRESVRSIHSAVDSAAALASLLEAFPAAMHGVRLGDPKNDVLEWPRQAGPEQAKRWRKGAAISRRGCVRLDELTARERGALVAVLRGEPVDAATASLRDRATGELA